MEKEKKKAKTSKSAKTEKPSSAELSKQEKEVLAIMEKLTENGIVEFNSRLISDKLGLEPDKGRNKIRNIMKKLEKAGKITIEKKAVKETGARKKYIYKLIE